jgi:hypothetical protein
MTFIDFDDSIYDDAVTGLDIAKYCNKKYKPTAFDLSFDTVVEKNDVWFIKRDFLPEFFSLIPSNAPNINVVTQHSDYEFDSSMMSMKPRSVVKVFAPNNTNDSEDSVAIPLGLGPSFGHGAPLAEDIKNKETGKNRNKLLYVNFRPYTYPQERQPLFSYFKENNFSWATVQESSDVSSGGWDWYLDSLTSHKFSLCPRGNGIDTHRLWESLYSRTVPVVRYCDANRNFLDLPILFVDDWSQVTERFLEEKYEEMASREWDYSKLSASWWGKQFKM